MATTRNELLENIKAAVESNVPQNVELDADTLGDIETAIDTVIQDTDIDDNEEDGDN